MGISSKKQWISGEFDQPQLGFSIVLRIFFLGVYDFDGVKKVPEDVSGARKPGQGNMDATWGMPHISLF